MRRKPPRPSLASAIAELAQAQRRTANATNEVAREQRITNLIVRAQLTADPVEREHLIHDAKQRMDLPRRRDSPGEH